MYARRLRDRETQDFLKRVEDFNSKQYDDAPESPQLSKTRYLSSSNISEEGIDNANDLLFTSDSASPFKRKQYQGSETDTLTSDDELAYKSAYNYEKTFSPTKAHYSKRDLDIELSFRSSGIKESGTRKTYAVSEEDYMLLQRLKLDASTLKDTPKESHAKVPSRGRPREELRDKQLYSRTSVREVDRLHGKKTSKFSEEEGEKPPSLPARRSKDTISIDEGSAPSLPRRKSNKVSTLGVPVERSVEPELSNRNYRNEDSNGKQNLTTVKPKRSVPPPVPRKRQISIDKSIISANLMTDAELSNDYLTSVSKNRLTDYKTLQPVPPPSARKEPQTPKKVSISHLDYLDSVQKKSPSPPRLAPISLKSSLTSPMTEKEISNSDKYLNSALKTKESDPKVSNVKPRPSLPAKPSSLKEKNVFNLSNTAKETSANGKPDFVAIKLRSPEKPKPQVPPKKNLLVTHKLKTASHDRLKAPIEDKFEMRKPEILVKLNKVDFKKNETTSDVPEALEKLRKLSKTQNAPAVPTRKISMPEALIKAETLRKQQVSDTKKASEPKPCFQDELSAAFKKANALSSVTSPTSKSVLNSSLKDAKRITQTPLTAPSKNERASEDSLLHPNKTRAKGPRRKLPRRIV